MLGREVFLGDWKGVPLSDAREPSTIVFTVRGPIARADLPGLYKRVCGLLERSDADLVVCDVGAHIEPDAVAVDAVARLQLAARQRGRRVCLRRASPELEALLAFMGLRDVVPSEPALPLEPRGQAEEREQSRRIQERRELDDLPA